jgi:hypothetical protein
MTAFTIQHTCRMCGSPMVNVLDLGDIYPSRFVTADENGTERVPLTLARCANPDCTLVQLRHTVAPDEMYRQYYYRSSLNAAMVAALRDIVDEALKLVDLRFGDAVVDIACNDGTLLGFYPIDQVKVGFDPAENLNVSHDNIDHFINDYFDAAKYPLGRMKAKIITSIAMFYDLPDPVSFTRQVKSILHEDGIWIIQLSDLVSMLEQNAFDGICHEHLEYYSAWDIISLMRREGLTVFRVSKNRVNGGSLRFFICHEEKREMEKSVQDCLMDESIFLGNEDGSMEAFNTRIRRIGYTVVNFLIEAKYRNQRVYGLAASTKGNTLLQYFGITSDMIPKIGDVNPDKYGKRTIGSDIEIVSEEEALRDKPEFLFLLAWHYVDTICLKLMSYLRQGGRIIVPLPEPRVYFHANGAVRSELLEKMPMDGL